MAKAPAPGRAVNLAVRISCGFLYALRMRRNLAALFLILLAALNLAPLLYMLLLGFSRHGSPSLAAWRHLVASAPLLGCWLANSAEWQG